MENEKDSLMRYDDSHAIFGMILSILGQTIITILIGLVFSVAISAGIRLFFPGSNVAASVDNFYEAFDIPLVIAILADAGLVLLYYFLMGSYRFKKILQGFKNKKLIFISIGLGLLVTFLSSGYTIITSQFIRDTNANQASVSSTITGNYVLGFIFAVIAAPIVEEIGSRYFIFGSLKSKSRVLAYTISAVIFALLHCSILIGEKNINWSAELIAFPVYLFMGLFLCAAYDKSGRLACPIVIHATNNFIAFISIILSGLIK